MKLTLSRHAFQRLRERLNLPSDMDIKYAATIVYGMWMQGIPFGGQAAKGELRLCHCERSGETCVIAASLNGLDGWFVTTVMTEAQARGEQERYQKRYLRHDRGGLCTKGDSRGKQIVRRERFRRRYHDDDE